MTSKTTFTLLPVLTLVQREVVRFYRQRSRIVGALGSPLIFWIFIGSGIGNSFRSGTTPQGMGYLEYFFPGTLALVLLFTAIFSTISVIEDRREGFLQSVLVAPVSRISVVAGKVLGGTLLAVSQGALFLLIAPFIGYTLSPATIGLVLLSLTLIGLSMTSLGFVFAWRLNSIQGFHAVMNLVLFPMWLLSGALFPVSEAPAWLRALMVVNPMTYGLALLRRAFYMNNEGAWIGLPSFTTSLVITIVFGIFFFVVATGVVLQRRTVGEA